MLAVLAGFVMISTHESNADLRAEAVRSMEVIRRDFYLASSKQYAEVRTATEEPSQIAFNWSVGVWLSALNAAAKVDASYLPMLAEYAEAVYAYWNPAPPVPGFDVVPRKEGIDRYYDDNAWMVMALVEAYDILGTKKHLDRAEAALTYVLSGESATLGGGIYWRESDKASKNTCSNAPAIAAILALHRYRPDSKRLETAKRLYAWTVKNLRDPEDNLYWDNITVADGKVERFKWSYNSALMIRAGKGLYAVTRDLNYLEDAIQTQYSSVKRWLPADGKEGIRCEGRFAHLLLEALLDPPACKTMVESASNAMSFVVQQKRDPKGRYPKRWDGEQSPALDRFELIDQASVARALWVLVRAG